MQWETKKVLITVKAYPEESIKYKESVCTAGITDEGEWIRLYPIPFEIFRGRKKFSKYDWIEVQCKPVSGEKLSRKESHKIRPNTIKVVDSSLNTRPTDWRTRNKFILPLVNQSIEDLQRKYELDRTSLGLIHPTKIHDFYKIKDLTDEEKQIAKFAQMTLDGIIRTKLIKIPYIFKYKFDCDDDNCKGHNILCEDWELLEAWRSWIVKYKTEELLWEKIYEKFYNYFINKCDLYFYMGTHSMFPTWLIIGVYYPPKN
jgi:hypothetical protein